MDWYPFYPALYRSHTMHLTAEQDGIYRRLIDYYMESRQPLPDNDFALARIAGVDNDCFKHASSILRAFFKHENGVLKHQKCDEILDEQDGKSKFYAKRAQKAAKIRHGKTKDLCLKHATSNSQAMLGDATIRDNNNNNNNNNNKNKEKSISDDFILPDWVPKQDWDDWIDQRKKKPKTRAKQLAVAKLQQWRSEGHHPSAILQASIVNGWEGLFSPTGKKANFTQSQPEKRNVGTL